MKGANENPSNHAFPFRLGDLAVTVIVTVPVLLGVSVWSKLFQVLAVADEVIVVFNPAPANEIVGG